MCLYSWSWLYNIFSDDKPCVTSKLYDTVIISLLLSRRPDEVQTSQCQFSTPGRGSFYFTPHCDTPLRPPRIHQLLKNQYYSWPVIHPVGSDRGITHFFTGTRNTTEGVREKEQTNNMDLGQLRMQDG